MAEETTPLLPSHLPPRNRHQYSWFLFLLCTVVVTLDFGASLSIAPQTQILENIICHNLHPNVAASSSLCKDIDVRSELALITGWKETFDQIPGIILALPYGFMADRIGRKRVVMLSLLGLMMQEVAIRVICWNALTIPPRAIWVTALFQVCGGGAQIGASMAYTILTDIYSVEQRSLLSSTHVFSVCMNSRLTRHRTNKFFILAAAALTSEILANPISAWLMTVSSPWLPYLLSLFCEFVGVLAALSLPETLPKFLHGDEDSASSPQIADDEDRNRDDGIFETYFRPAWTQVLRIREFIWKDKNILAISCAFFVGNVGQQALRLMLQYVSKRFGWSMAEVRIIFPPPPHIFFHPPCEILTRIRKSKGKHPHLPKRPHNPLPPAHPPSRNLPPSLAPPPPTPKRPPHRPAQRHIPHPRMHSHGARAIRRYIHHGCLRSRSRVGILFRVAGGR
ncbi:hypothetical protein BDV12DRAFT_172074 [Aspergillus spectabilis]